MNNAHTRGRANRRDNDDTHRAQSPCRTRCSGLCRRLCRGARRHYTSRTGPAADCRSRGMASDPAPREGTVARHTTQRHHHRCARQHIVATAVRTRTGTAAGDTTAARALRTYRDVVLQLLLLAVQVPARAVHVHNENLSQANETRPSRSIEGAYTRRQHSTTPSAAC